MSICDYAGYDYKKAFWENQGRDYEDRCERQTLTRLLQRVPKPIHTLMDIGCGFGRLFPTYEPFAQDFVLLDFAQHLLDQAKSDLKTTKPIQFVQGNMMAMPLKDHSIDCAISVRTLHHVSDPQAYFSDVFRVLKPGGIFIFEIPNQRHILNIFKFITGRLHQNPFKKTPLRVNQSFLNFHPEQVFNWLRTSGFSVLETTNTSFFRSAVLKKWIGSERLAQWDAALQPILSWIYLTPSLYVMAQRHP